MSTPKIAGNVCSLPSIDYELRFGINPDGYHSTLAKLQLRRAIRVGSATRRTLEAAHAAEADYHRVYPDGRPAA